MLNTFSLIFTLVGAFLGVDRYYLHLAQLGAMPLLAPTAASLIGMLLGFISYAAKKKKKQKKRAMALAVAGLCVCLAATALWLYQVLAGRTISLFR